MSSEEGTSCGSTSLHPLPSPKFVRISAFSDDAIMSPLVAKDRIASFNYPFDGRFEDLWKQDKGSFKALVFRDFCAGLIVAMVAIPLAMGFAIASGLNPVHGIVGGAVAAFFGAVFGGSKYQVYGPTAALIPVIRKIMHSHGGDDPLTYNHAYGVLTFTSLLAGVILSCMGIFGLGRHVAKVPHSIVVGFTLGIAFTIVMAEMGEILGIQGNLDVKFTTKCEQIWANLFHINPWCLFIGLCTFLVIKLSLLISVYIPGPVLALVICTSLSLSLLKDKGLIRVMDRYGPIPAQLLKITPPQSPEAFTFTMILDVIHGVVSIVVVSAIESLLCSRMADRLAHNNGLPFSSNRELWGQGIINIFVPLLNGFPHTGALARTATNIKLGAVSPLAGIFKGILKLLLACYFRVYLEQVPMACIGGILLYVAWNMISPSEVFFVMQMNRLHKLIMIYTALMMIFTDFSIGVITALAFYHFLKDFLDVQLDEKTPLLMNQVEI